MRYREFAVGLLIAVLGLSVASLPAAFRVASQGVSFVAAWLALWGSAALMLGPAAGAWRVARPVPSLALAVPAGLVVALPVLILFARILKAQTHHRPLGAATFAVIAAVIALGAIAVMARLSRSRIAFAGVTGVAALLGVVLALPLLSTAVGSVLDAVLAFAVVAAAAWVKLPARLDAVARIGAPVALAVAAIAGMAVRSDPVRAISVDKAPVLAGPLG